ncbi:MAG: PadR family transcriptional regulator [Candidatus Micrarchaeia archaeon]
MKIFAKGLLKLFILCEAEKPVSGKMISERIEDLTMGSWKPSPGAIYPLLRKMEEEELVKAELSDSEGRREIVYTITEKGRKHLSEGRKRVMRRADVTTVFLPLITKVMYNFDDDEIKELSEQFKKFESFREKFLKLPEKKRKESFKKICDFFERVIEE